MADRLTIVRSFTTGDGKHDIKPVVGRDTLGANIGSVYARVAGPNHPRTGMPTNVASFPQAVDPDTSRPSTNFGDFDADRPARQADAPFVPGGEGEMQQAMRLAFRWTGSTTAGNCWPVRRPAGPLDAGGGARRARRHARAGVSRDPAAAWPTPSTCRKEDPNTVARYDTAPLCSREAISSKWNNHPHYIDNAKSLGKLLLLARRLCEAGCGFVTVTTNFVWDMHADSNNAGDGRRAWATWACRSTTPCRRSSTICTRAGSTSEILLVVCGEMGRTPRINSRGGRDHWGNLAPLLLAGGGLPMGQVIGQSTRDGSQPLTEPVTDQAPARHGHAHAAGLERGACHARRAGRRQPGALDRRADPGAVFVGRKSGVGHPSWKGFGLIATFPPKPLASPRPMAHYKLLARGWFWRPEPARCPEGGHNRMRT